ncbi:putative cysteinyl-tRNA synthetase [Schistosoma mansoni]|nr:putative cysteinyl-tRNA synthetase [Schistosoma mansoni]|eukprot:XP_018648320.1 putative cysteinyl-tRNA synthetase [Schistosoma mansoni]
MEKRTQPKWVTPVQNVQNGQLPNLYLYNSLTSQKDLFIPQDGRHVKWYTCGPTVYDVSHLGHARTYVAFDVIRRVLMDYFNFKVTYVLNITDIDDKIIKRARQNHLISDYQLKNPDLATVIGDITKGIQRIKSKIPSETDPDKKAHLNSEVDRLTSLLSTVPLDEENPANYLILNARDAIADTLDAAYGASISDHQIFEALARHFEKEYLVDMECLNIIPPSVLVRVTEYIDPIIKYVKQIIDNGFAYVVPSGSVYFDTNRFASSPMHFYAKLVPTAYGDTSQLESGEGELCITGEKKSSNDFALWKASKPGEPSWPSPWGKGRPGWHIECSVMASDILGDTLDIHSGGVDLKFPHHDNELAQSEAYFGHSHWVNYFLHSGHLTISGCKMSKSLKNFITIRDALKTHTSRQIRLIFLLHSWRDTMDYSVDTLAEAVGFEKQLIDFLYTCSNIQFLAKQSLSNKQYLEETEDSDFKQTLVDIQHKVYDALCDSCDTRSVLDCIKVLMSEADSRIFSRIEPNKRISNLADDAFATEHHENIPLREADESAFGFRSWLSLDRLTEERLISSVHKSLEASSIFIQAIIHEGDTFKEIVDTFACEMQKQYGIDLFNVESDGRQSLECILKTTNQTSLSESTCIPHGLEINVWPVVLNFLHILVSVRNTIRKILSSGSITDSSCKKRLYEACDRFRDIDLVNSGIRLQDRATAIDLSRGLDISPFIGLVDKKFLISEHSESKTKRVETKVIKEIVKQETGHIPPWELFLSEVDKYSKFDSKGMPTHDASGNELTKSALKKLQKLYIAQEKRHAAFLKSKE